MSLVIALKGSDAVVVAADTLGVREDPDGICKFKCSKLRRVHKRKWVIAATGSDGVFDLIEALNRRNFDFGQDPFMGIPRYARELWTEYRRRRCSGVMDFLLAGTDSSFPFIQRWSFDAPEHERSIRLIGPSMCDADHEAIGVCGHGGLYFAAEYHREDMNTNQMVSLAHFSISQVAKNELLVGEPVEIAIVDRNVAVCLSDAKIPGLRARSESIAAWLRSMFRESRGGITLGSLPKSQPLVNPKALSRGNRNKR
jgi:hypothetical protein